MKDKYICQCCGGKINRVNMTCEYCGTQYKEDYSGQIIQLETFTNHVKKLVCRTAMPRENVEFLGVDYAVRSMKRQMLDDLTDALSDVMSYRVEYDPCERVYSMYGILKAIIPVDDENSNMGFMK